MGVICGIFHTDDKPVSYDKAMEMMDKLSIYPMDISDTWCKDQVFMGCGIKYITPESKDEKMPYYDYEADLLIAADAIIDNRSELFNLLDVSPVSYKGISDSSLILLAYKKWGEECPKYIIGDFTFAIWNRKKRELFCARDHVGKRTFYFYYSKGIFAFCTVIKPLLSIDSNVNRINDRWAADFLSLPGVAHEFDCTQSAYKDIQQLLPAHTIKITSSKMMQRKYWSPLDTPRLSLKSDKEYEEAFLDVFSKAVDCRLRSTGSVGVMLSGGLDSGSIACIAAKKLATRGGRLKAFSSIPSSDYKDWLPRHLNADERIYIELIRKYTSNIDITYCSCEGKHSFKDAKRLITILEQPYKTVENLFWYDEITSLAAKTGCTVLLDGQYGNATISFGNFWIQAISLYRGFKLITLLKEINAYSRFYGLSRRRTLRTLASKVLPYRIKKLRTRLKGDNYDFTEFCAVNPELSKMYNVQQRFNKEEWNIYPPKSYDLSQERILSSAPQAFSHMGALETKISLAYGIAKRDPSRDKRVIEFCNSLPGNQFVRDGRGRYLIRRTMNGILPDEIRLNYSIRGQQSADWIQRLVPVWGVICTELADLLEDDKMKDYLDIPKLKKALNKVRAMPLEKDWDLIRMLLISLNFWYFLKSV
jgi:asparagine synthase (glutamine-hydrolysing)